MARFGAVGAPGALPARSAARPTSTGPSPALVPAGVAGKPLPPALRRTAALIFRCPVLAGGEWSHFDRPSFRPRADKFSIRALRTHTRRAFAHAPNTYVFVTSAIFKGIVPGVIARRAPPYRVFSPGGVVRAPRTSPQAVGRQRKKKPSEPPSAFILGVLDTPAGVVVGVDVVDDGRAADSAANIVKSCRSRTFRFRLPPAPRGSSSSLTARNN